MTKRHNLKVKLEGWGEVGGRGDSRGFRPHQGEQWEQSRGLPPSSAYRCKKSGLKAADEDMGRASLLLYLSHLRWCQARDIPCQASYIREAVTAKLLRTMQSSQIMYFSVKAAARINNMQ